MSEHEDPKQEGEEPIQDLELDPESEEDRELTERVRGGRAPVS